MLLVLSIPYVENQTLIWGYAGLPMTANLLCGMALLSAAQSRGFRGQHAVFLIIFALLAFACVSALKNIGIYYAALGLSSYLVSNLLPVVAKKVHFYSLKAFVTILSFAFGLMFFFINYLPSQDAVISLFGKQLHFIGFDHNLIAVIGEAIFLNSSYSLAPIATLIVIYACTKAPYDLKKWSPNLFFSIAAITSTLIYLSIFGTEYGFSRSLPGADTGGTRHWFTPVMLWLAMIFSCSRSVNTFLVSSHAMKSNPRL